MIKFDYSMKGICALGFIVSFLLTTITIYHYPVINIDGLFYFKIANRYLHEGGRATFSHCAWPFYPILLGVLQKFTHLGFLKIAYLLNYIFSALTVVVFALIVGELGGSKKQVWFGLLTILIFISFNHYRGEILRDHGYWLFYLFSVYFLMRFCKINRLFSAILWGASLFIALLFRIEGFLFLIFSPSVILFLQDIAFLQKIKMLFKLYFVPVIALGLGVILLKHLGLSSHQLNDTNRLYNEITSGFLLIYSNIHNMYWHIRQTAIGGLASNQDAALFLVFGLVGLYLFDFLSVITWGFFIPIVCSIFLSGKELFSNSRRVLFIYVFINIALTFGFFLQYRGFLSSRYLFPMALTLALLVPFGFSILYQRWQCVPRKLNLNNLLFCLTCILMFAMLLGSLHRFGHSKVYIYKAAVWVRKNTTTDSKIYTNHAVLGYLTERSSGGYEPAQADYFSFDKMANQPWKGYDYAVFVTDNSHIKEMVAVEKMTNSEPLKVFFDNHNRDQAFIFRLSK